MPRDLSLTEAARAIAEGAKLFRGLATLDAAATTVLNSASNIESLQRELDTLTRKVADAETTLAARKDEAARTVENAKAVAREDAARQIAVAKEKAAAISLEAERTRVAAKLAVAQSREEQRQAEATRDTLLAEVNGLTARRDALAAEVAGFRERSARL